MRFDVECMYSTQEYDDIDAFSEIDTFHTFETFDRSDRSVRLDWDEECDSEKRAKHEDRYCDHTAQG